MRRSILGMGLAVFCPSIVLAQSNIDGAHKFAWGENISWTNWRDANSAADGVIVGADFLSGYIWAENVGWIDVGDGNGPYANTNSTDYGVNVLANDNLSGYAWGENIGWINFDTSGNAPSQARFDFGAGRFRGYAWGENVGWINLDDGGHFVSAAFSPDPVGTGNDVCSGGLQNGLPCSRNADCPGGACHSKNRYVSISPSSGVTVIELTAMSLPAALSAFTGDVWYAGAPTVHPEGTGGTFKAAPLLCGGAELRDWGAEGLVHLHGAIVVPGASYELRQCVAIGGPCSSPLVVETAKHGDIVPPLGLGQPNFIDISAIVDKFKGLVGAVSKTRAQLQPNVPNPANAVNFLDISADVDAFKGLPYAFPAAACP